MRLNWIFLATHAAVAIAAGAAATVVMLAGLDTSYLLVIVPVSIAGAALASWFLSSRIGNALASIERAAVNGERAHVSGMREIDAAAEQISESCRQWIEVATNSREQSREINALLAQLDRRDPSRNRSGKNAGVELRGVLRGFSSTCDEQLAQVAQCVMEIDHSTRAIADGSETQSEIVSKTASGVEQLSANIGSVSQSAEAAQAAFNNARQSAHDAIKLIQEMAQGIQHICTLVDASERNLSVLDNRSSAIAALVETLGAIASRTDLLALNASIESVRAGEHGRGFAIVAEEIRKLAEQAAQATGEMTGLVESIQRETQESIAVIAQERTEVDREMRRVGSARKALEQIGTVSNDSAGKVAGIVTAAQRQLKMTQEIVAAVERIAGTAKSIRSRAERASWTTRTLAKSAHQLDQSLVPMRADSRLLVPHLSNSQDSDDDGDRLLKETTQFQRNVADFTAAPAGNADKARRKPVAAGQRRPNDG